MKRKSIALVLLLIVAIGTAACKETAQKQVVKNEKESQLQQVILKEGTLSESLPSETSWKEELTIRDKSATIHVDAAIEATDSKALSAVSGRPKHFTIEEVKEVIHLFYGDTKLYKSQTDKEWLETEIKREKENLAYLKEHGKYPEDTQMVVPDGVENEIAWMEGHIADLEKEYEVVSAGPVAVTDIAFEDNDSYGESLILRDDQEIPMEYVAYNDNSGVYGSGMEYAPEGFDISGSGKELEDGQELELSISRKEAQQKAMDIVKSCGVSEECKIVSTEERQVNGESSYQFRLVRMISGVPNTPIYDFVSAPSVEGEERPEAWRQESIIVVVNDKGVVGFSWEAPPEIEVLNDNVAIKSFDEIKEVARTILPMQLEEIAKVGDPKDVTIYEVQLNMMRVTRQDKESAYYYLPVWDFMGYHGELTEEETSFLTINALDGSVIDRGVGF